MMRFHDYHLRGYTVSEFGSRIVLDLVFEYEGLPRQVSKIEFSSVVMHNFVQTGGVIITDIVEMSAEHFVGRQRSVLDDAAKWIGVGEWYGYDGDFVKRLEKAQLKIWEIYSAVGFKGFVVGGEVAQLELGA